VKAALIGGAVRVIVFPAAHSAELRDNGLDRRLVRGLLTRILSYIPEPPDRSEAFEPLLDELAAIFSPGQELAPAWASAWTSDKSASRYTRCQTKRRAIATAARRNLAAVREHADLLLRALVHDQCRSGNRQLAEPLIAALGRRRAQEALITYVETGTDAETIGATMAMYWAGVPLRYRNWSRQELTAASNAELESLADLRDRYRQACLHAFVTRGDPQLRFALSLGFTLDPAGYPPELLPVIGHAQRIILANPGRYERILHTRKEHPNPAGPSPAEPPDP
jgi:hypothetical protein